MTDIENDELLESVADITEQRDLESLEVSVVETIFEFVPAIEVALYKIHDQEALLAARADENGVENGGSLIRRQDGVILLNESDEFMDCLDEQAMVVREIDDLNKFIYPILTEGRVVGFLSALCTQNRDCDQWLISGLLRIYQNFLSVINESERDKLTGLLNRKRFDDKIARMMQSDRDPYRQKSPVENRRPLSGSGSNWLAILDIDHFKRINDTFGHLYGDEVLLLISRLMRKTFRSHDLLFRYGGEEFIVVLPSLPVHDVLTALERFRKAVESFDFPQVGKVTVSIGFVDMAGQYVPATVVGHADQALYYAKRNGRNRICSYEDLLAAGEIVSGISSGEAELF